MLADFLGHHYRAMLSAGAAESDCQITLSLMNVVRKEIDQKLGDSRNEFAGLRKRADVACDFRITARQWAEFGNEVRVGKKADIEDQVGIFGYSLAKTETDARDEDA